DRNIGSLYSNTDPDPDAQPVSIHGRRLRSLALSNLKAEEINLRRSMSSPFGPPAGRKRGTSGVRRMRFPRFSKPRRTIDLYSSLSPFSSPSGSTPIPFLP